MSTINKIEWNDIYIYICFHHWVREKEVVAWSVKISLTLLLIGFLGIRWSKDIINWRATLTLFFITRLTKTAFSAHSKRAPYRRAHGLPQSILLLNIKTHQENMIITWHCFDFQAAQQLQFLNSTQQFLFQATQAILSLHLRSSEHWQTNMTNMNSKTPLDTAAPFS